MDLVLTNDFYNQSQMLAAEICEYLPKGEGWQYVRDGRIAFDGDRPVNSNGGRCPYGHEVKRTRLRGFGGAQNLLNIMLEKK